MMFLLSICIRELTILGLLPSRGGVRGGREGALAPPDLPNFYIYIYIYIFFMCVVVKGGDLIEIVINSA